jgi:hypothetical protein
MAGANQNHNPDSNLPAQARFLYAVSQLNPGVLQSLRKLSDAQTRLPTRQALKQWVRQRNLGAEWVVDWAAHTISWQRNGPSRRWDRFYHPRESLRSRFERKPATINEAIHRRIRGIDFGDWAGIPMTKSAARQRAAQTFQRILRESFEEVETRARDAGLFEPKTRRSRGSTKKSSAPKRSENEVFLWLAGYQTRAWSRGRIAEAVDVERNAVGMAIRGLAADLKMELRANRLYDKSETSEVISRELEAARSAERRAYELLLEE